MVILTGRVWLKVSVCELEIMQFSDSPCINLKNAVGLSLPRGSDISCIVSFLTKPPRLLINSGHLRHFQFTPNPAYNMTKYMSQCLKISSNTITGAYNDDRQLYGLFWSVSQLVNQLVEVYSFIDIATKQTSVKLKMPSY